MLEWAAGAEPFSAPVGLGDGSLAGESDFLELYRMSGCDGEGSRRTHERGRSAAEERHGCAKESTTVTPYIPTEGHDVTGPEEKLRQSWSVSVSAALTQ